MQKSILLKKFILIVLVFLLSNLAMPQTYKGTVKDSLEEAIPFANVVLYTLPDSTFVTGSVTDDSGEFIIESTNIFNKGYLEISCIGYKTKRVLLDFRDKSVINLGNVILYSDIQNIKGVVVTAKRPTYTSKKGKSIFYTANSTLSDIGNATDLLKRTPRLIVNSEGELQIPGKGNVLIYIDNHIVQNNEELKMLNSNEIDRIEIITNPSAKYEATGQAVVKIVTRTQKQNGINYIIDGNTVIARKNSFGAGSYIGYKKNKLYLFVYYGYTNQKNKNYRGFYRENSNLNNIIKMEYDEVQSLYVKKHNYKSGIRYEINNRQYLDFLYTGWSSNKNILNNIESTYTSDSITRNNLTNSEKPSNYYNSYRLNHCVKLDTIGQKIESSFSYINNRSNSVLNYKSKLDVVEKRDKDQQLVDIYIAKTDYSVPKLIWGIDMQTGLKYSYTNSNSRNNLEENTEGEWTPILNHNRRYSFDEHIFSSYISINKKIGKFDCQLGLRWENYNSKAIINDTIKISTPSLNKIFPSFALSYDFSEAINTTISYSKRVKHPSYTLLNPYFKYKDNFTNKQGNPYLKPEFSDVVEISTFIGGDLEVNMGYTHKKDFINYAYIRSKEEPNILTITADNYDKAELFSASIAYTFYNKSETWEIYNMIGVVKPIIEVYDSGKKRRLTKPTYYISHSQEYEFPFKLSLYLGIDLFFPGEDDMFRYKSMQNISLGIRQPFLKNKLLLSVWFNDIFNTENFNRKLNLNNIIIKDYLDGDDTYIRVSLRYKFGSEKTKFKMKNSEEDRLKDNLIY